MTDYVILRRNDGENPEWVDIATVYKASSPRRAVLGANLGVGEYVAIPQRSWKPMTVKIEQTTKVTIG